MPNRWLRKGDEVRLDLAEGALRSGLALVIIAESQLHSGIRRDARRSLREADAAWGEAQRRSYRLDNGDGAEVRRGLEDLRYAIDSVRRRIAAPGQESATAKVIRMPARTGWPD